MEVKRNFMHHYAMVFGTIMGAYWIFKFIFFPLGLSQPFCSMIFMGLTLCVPYMAYKLSRNYRNQILGGSITFGHAYSFTLLMYMFAALLVSVAHYIYFAFMDNGFIAQAYEEQLNMLEAAGVTAEMKNSFTQFREAIELFREESAIDITIGLLSWNLFCGIILSIINAILIRKSTPKTYDNND